MFLPLEECDPHVTVAVCRGSTTLTSSQDCVPRLLAVDSSSCSFLALSIRYSHCATGMGLTLSVNFWVCGLLPDLGGCKTAGHGRQRDVKGTGGRRGQGGKNNSGGAGVSGGDLGNYARGQAGQTEFKAGPLIDGDMNGNDAAPP